MDLRHDDKDRFTIDEQLDLLVDEELPERQRQALLLWLDANPRRWRDLSIRFLQRQVENKAIRDLLAAKTSTNAYDAPSRDRKETTGLVSESHGRSLTVAARGVRYLAMAAGLLTLVTAAFLAVHFVSRPAIETPMGGAGAVAGGPEVVTTPLPGSLWNVKGTRNVSVPVTTTDTPVLFPANASHQSSQRRTVVITPDGSQNALIIPVTNLQYQ
ncbi:MAG: hypothetical protein FWD61_06405 [Phycisphaerales bacterium]|nr:hypothetical protein [Phycisphaerales bacterium]